MSKYLELTAQRLTQANNDKTAEAAPWYANPYAQAGIGAGLGGLAGAGLGYGLGGGTGALIGGLGGAALGGGLGYANAAYDPFGLNFAALSDDELGEAIVAAREVNDPILDVLMQELQRRDQSTNIKTGGAGMLNVYWRDKIAAAAAEAEQAIAEETAGVEGGDDPKIEEDIMIAEEVAATDLPLETKVQILEEQGVEPEIIEEVVAGDTVDAVAAYYGINPEWLHDKVAGNKMQAAMAGMKTLGQKAGAYGQRVGQAMAKPIKVAKTNFDRSMGGNPAGVFGGRLKAVRTALFGSGGMWNKGGNLGKAYIAGAGLTGAGALGAGGYGIYNAIAGQPEQAWYNDPRVQAGLGAAGAGLLGAGIGYGVDGGRGALLGGAAGALGGGAAGYYGGRKIQDYAGRAADYMGY